MTNKIIPIKTALISVSDKTNLLSFAQELIKFNVSILSTGGTADALRKANIPVTDVSDYTKFPEMMDGRIKTLHPKIHGGLLARRDNDNHISAQKEHDIQNIDLVVVNLYPFEETIAKTNDVSTVIENIDIGGPAMLRSAAKNHEFVTVVTDIADYDTVLSDLKQHNGTSLQTRINLATKTYSRTALYDSTIAGWFNQNYEIKSPKYFTVGGTKKQEMRYGENPHQHASIYTNEPKRLGAALATQLQGKELSYNNINDTDAAFELVSELDVSKPACVIVKHANPCGVSYGSTLQEAYLNALQCDSVSAFGGIIAFNQKIDEKTASEVVKIFTEVIIAPEVTDEAKKIIASKSNLRLLITGGLADNHQKGVTIKSVAGGLLVQNRDDGIICINDLKIVTKRQPTEQELQDLLFAFKVAKHVKSNAIIYAKNGMTVGIGAGQMSRVDSCMIAANKALEASKNLNLTESLAKNSVVASDAFFPFADGLLEVAKAGVTAVIQPGGSIRDEEVIAAANEHNLAMVFTGMRHFRH